MRLTRILVMLSVSTVAFAQSPAQESFDHLKALDGTLDGDRPQD